MFSIHLKYLAHFAYRKTDAFARCIKNRTNNVEVASNLLLHLFLEMEHTSYIMFFYSKSF